MPCLAIHLAVAKKYLEIHSEEDQNEFLKGTLAPDVNYVNLSSIINGINTTDKNAGHFGFNKDVTPTMTVVKYMKNKVDLGKFLSANELDTPFKRAYFLHLLCDYYFFGMYIKDDSLSKYTFSEGVKLGFNDYNIITPILIKKYNLEIPDLIKDIIFNPGFGSLTFMTEDIVDTFIKEMSNINLDEETKKYKK